VGEGKNDNIDNFRGNQYSCRDKDNLNQQLKQLYLTTFRSQQHSERQGKKTSGEGDDLNDNNKRQ
jgi:hypothetical protein